MVYFPRPRHGSANTPDSLSPLIPQLLAKERVFLKRLGEQTSVASPCFNRKEERADTFQAQAT